MGLVSWGWGQCLHLVWPARCAGCDVELASERDIFCGVCAQAVIPIVGGCRGCAAPRDHAAKHVAKAMDNDGALPVATSTRGRCRACLTQGFTFSRASAGFEYGASLAAAIVRMKHGDRPDLALRLGRLLGEPLWRLLHGSRTLAAPRPPGQSPEDDSDAGTDADASSSSSWRDAAPIDLVVPVPLHPRKLRRRGFNQALELARVALRWSPPGRRAPPRRRLPRLERNLLRRIRDTRELGRSSPRERRAEVEGAFVVADPARVAGRRVLVVDDVMTSGATLSACGEALLTAGARDVSALALARA